MLETENNHDNRIGVLGKDKLMATKMCPFKTNDACDSSCALRVVNDNADEDEFCAFSVIALATAAHYNVGNICIRSVSENSEDVLVGRVFK